MLSKKPVILIILITILTSLSLGSQSSKEIVLENITDYFAQKIGVDESDIFMKLLHYPDNLKISANSKILVESRNAVPGLGHQTLKLKVFLKNGTIENYRITVTVSAKMKILVAKTDLKRNEWLDENKLEIKTVLITNNNLNIVKSIEQVKGLVTKQVIRAGDQIKRDMLYVKPDIERGENITLQFVRNHILIEADGKAKESGVIGDKIRVMCETSRKFVKGTILTPNVVVVNIK